MKTQISFLALLISTSLTLAGCQDTPADGVVPVKVAQEQADSPRPSSTSKAPRDRIAGLKNHASVQAAFADIVSHRESSIETLIELTEIPAPPFG